jgi:hypothetical protein
MQYRTIKDVRGTDINVSAHPERYMRIIAITVGPISLHIPMDRVDEIISALNGAQHFVWEFDHHPDNIQARRAGDVAGTAADLNPVAYEQTR